MENCTSVTKPNGFMKGFKDGIPIALGYIPISIACAIAAIKAGLSVGVSELLLIMQKKQKNKWMKQENKL